MVILIIWSIAQFIQKARQASAPPGRPPPTRRPAPPINDEVREMLEQLAGRSIPRQTAHPNPFANDEDDEEELMSPPPVSSPPQPVRAARPARTTRASTQSAPRPPAYSAPIDFDTLPPAIADIAPMLTADDHALATRSASTGLTAFGQSLRMKGTGLQGLVAMPSSSSSRKRGTAFLTLRELQNRNLLRRAILTKIILDPPRGLAPYGNENQ